MEKSIQNKVDSVWTTFFSGGVANPLTVIEQITYLLFIKGLDEIETNNEKIVCVSFYKKSPTK